MFNVKLKNRIKKKWIINFKQKHNQIIKIIDVTLNKNCYVCRFKN